MKKRVLLGSLVLVLAQLAWTQEARRLTIDSLFAPGGITGRAPETIKWSPDGRTVSFVQRDDSGEHGALYGVDVASGKRAVLVPEEKLASLAPPLSTIQDERRKEYITRYSVASYQWAPDSRHLLFDSLGQLWLYSLDTGTAVQLTSTLQSNSDPKFSPDGSRLAYIRDHNLYVQPVTGKGEKQLTKDAADMDDVLNGEVDWVYAEELDVRSNYFWSPDGKQIAFLQMNEKPVPSYPITDWIPQKPRVDEEKYPKAGDPNPGVRVGVVGAGGRDVKWITAGEPTDREYIPRFGWLRPGVLWIQLLNRAQDKLELWFADVGSGKSRKMLTESEPGAWVPVNDDFQVLSSGDRFLWSSWRDGYTHLYLYGFDKGDPLGSAAKLQRQLTDGTFDVIALDAVDETKGMAYFTANANDPRQRQLYSVRLDGSGAMERLSSAGGTHDVAFAPNAAYYVDNFSALLTPPSLSLCRVGGNCDSLWQSRSVAEDDLIAPRMLELKAADGVTTLYGTLLVPPHATGKVPLLLNPYGGPEAQVVLDAWAGSPADNILFDEILARSGLAILRVDNRGTSGRGKAFATALRHKLGHVELADQLAALQQVLDKNPQLDATRVGIWGWSYGGYLTLYALTHSDKFKAGIAVAPVTNWLDYDSIYTERYMGLPKDYPGGYRDSSPVNSAGQLKGRLLEVHGTSDDNVHLQNTMQMISALIDAGVQFDLQLYPGKTHGIAGQAAQRHLFHAIQHHLETYLMGREAAVPQKRTPPDVAQSPEGQIRAASAICLQ